MRKILLLVVPFFLSFGLYAQNGYVIIDKSTTIGENIVDNGAVQNSKICTIERYDTSIIYTPYDIWGYGIEGSKSYISKEILIDSTFQKVFLEILENNETSLFGFEDEIGPRFFIGKDSSELIEIYKNETDSKLHYSDTLSSLLNNCTLITQEHKYVPFKKSSLARFIKNYNDCKYSPYPRFRFGAQIAYHVYKYIIKDYDKISENINLTTFGGFSYHLFIDQPINASYFSLHLELSYAKKAYARNMKYKLVEYDFVSNVSTISIPILFRYDHPSNKFLLFFNMGGLINFNKQSDHMMSEYKYVEEDVYVTVSPHNYIRKRQVGYAFGGGIEYRFGIKYALQAELRYNRLLSLDKYELGLHYISFNLGIIL